MFYDVYAALCKNKGISLSRAADEIGLSNSTVTKWKKTGATPSGETLAKVAAYFGVSVDDLIGEVQPETEMKDQLIAFYGKVKDHLTEDDIDDIMASTQPPLRRPMAVALYACFLAPRKNWNGCSHGLRPLINA